MAKSNTSKKADKKAGKGWVSAATELSVEELTSPVLVDEAASSSKKKKKDKKADSKKLKKPDLETTSVKDPAKRDKKIATARDEAKGKATDKVKKKNKKKSTADEAVVELSAVLAQTPVEAAEELAKAAEPPTPAKAGKKAVSAEKLESLLRVGEDFQLASVDPSSTPGFDGDKDDAVAAVAAGVAELGDWQERLYAEAKGGGKRSVLLVVQGMDTSGKGGVMRHVVAAMDPQGIKLTSFKAPTAEERAKGYLWRIRNALPAPGQVGVFDRSQYEDVLVVRVHNLVPRSSWARRYSGINTFERQTASKGVAIVKVMLHISADEQKVRLAERIERPDKWWKYNPADIDEREHWDDYQAAYQDALTKCSTDDAPWYVVPADHKWYAHWAIQQIMLATFRRLDPQWPAAEFDPAVEAERLAST